MHISVEGVDGSGKSTLCRLISEQLSFEYVEKPLRFLFDDHGDISVFKKITRKVNACDSRLFVSWFYGLESIYQYTYYRNQNIITDRHILSYVSWCNNQDAEKITDLILEIIGVPDVTVILYVSPETQLARLQKRNINDNDIQKLKYTQDIYNRMTDFVIKKQMPVIFIHSDSKTPEEIARYVITCIREKTYAEKMFIDWK